MHNIVKTWEDLADRTNGKGIDKDTFLQYFPMTGLLGDRLFAQFDVKKTGYLDLDEFVIGLASFCRGTLDEKIHFLFNMYDTCHNNTVSKEELTTLLNQVPKYVLHPEMLYGYPASPEPAEDHRPSSASGTRSLDGDRGGAKSLTPPTDPSHPALIGGSLPPAKVPTPQSALDPLKEEDIVSESESESGDELEQVDEFTNHDMVEKAFLECDLNHEGRLSYEQFKMWVQRTPGIIEYLESIMPWAVKDDTVKRHSQRNALPIYGQLKRVTSVNSMGRIVRQNSIGGLVLDNGGRPPSMQRSTSHGPMLDSAGSSSPAFDVGGGVSIGGGSTATAGNYLVGIHKPSPLAMPTPLLARSNSVSTPVEAFRHSYRGNSPMSMQSPSPPLHDTLGLHDMVIEEAVRALLYQAMESTHCDALHRLLSEVLDQESKLRAPTEAEVLDQVVTKNGNLFKRGNKLHWWNKRWCVLSGNSIYYYNHESDVRPKGVIFLAGTIIEKVVEESSEIKGYYGFEILHQDISGGAGEHHRHEQRILYARTSDERESWIHQLQVCAQVIPIEEDYVIGKELGRGRFSIVCECVRKETGERMAVKIIEKASLELDEKELLRTEIAALKLVNHPNIVCLEGLYETRSHMYIVMEKLVGGELFERIVGHPRFTEGECAKLIRPLLESVAYLHDMGIVHRDLKPENILCGENLENIKLADFGLSKMFLPSEKMDTACGTLSYVAPEVLTMQGYGKEADLWSIGVIMFLLVCGKLPFDGADNDEIIRATINADLKAPPKVWAVLTEQTKGLITALLCKSPKLRITAREALRHRFIETFYPYEKHHRRVSYYPYLYISIYIYICLLSTAIYGHILFLLLPLLFLILHYPVPSYL
jgi:Ca2+-binding EF-hand superfamily protein